MKYYSSYVNHMLRFYARYCDKKPENFKKPVDAKNWQVVKSALDKLPENDRNVIIEVYRRRDTLGDNIYEVSKEFNIDQDVIWTMLNKVTKKIAQERGLI